MPVPTTDDGFIQYQEHEGASESWDHERNEASRTLRCPWNQRAEFMASMLGFPTNIGPVLLRALPEVHPDYEWMRAARCELINGLGYPGAGSAGQLAYKVRDSQGNASNTPGYAVYRVTYRGFNYEFHQDAEAQASPIGEMCRYVERLQTYAGESVTYPDGSFQWGPGEGTFTDKTIFEAVPRNLLTKQLTYIWHQVPLVPNTAIENCIGRVNSAVFDGRYPVNTLLFIAPEVEPIFDVVGNVIFNIKYQFIYRSDGWNKLLAPDGRFRAVVRKADTTKSIYETADFAQLFTLLV